MGSFGRMGKVDLEKLIELFDSGLPLTQIADRLEVDRKTVQNWCKKLGLKREIKRTPIPEEGLPRHLKRVVILYNKGRKYREIARELNLSYASVNTYLTKARHLKKYLEYDAKMRERERVRTALTIKCTPMTKHRGESREWLKTVLIKNGIWQRTLRFQNERDMLRFLVKIFMEEEIERDRQKVLTHWLKNNGLTKEQIACLYKKLGLAVY